MSMTMEELEELDRLTDKLVAAVDKATEKPETALIKQSLETQVNSALLTFNNHSNDNSFISNELSTFISNLRNSNYIPYGVCMNPPYSHYDSPMVGYVFYDERDEVRWVHMPKRALLHLLSEIHGREEAKRMLGME